MQLVRFRHKGLKQLYEDGESKGVPAALADKLRKLLFALETACGYRPAGTISGMEIASSQRRLERLLELDGHRKLAVIFVYDEKTNTAGNIDLLDYHWGGQNANEEPAASR